MSLWSNFLDNIAKPIGSAIAAGAKQAGDFLGSAIASPAQGISQMIIPAGTNIGLAKYPGGQELTEAARKGIQQNLEYEAFKSAQSNDLLLKAAVALEENVISPAITRPISTFGLVTDPNSPLYQSDIYEKGFQLKDIARAYNRSEFVSPRQALLKSALVPEEFQQLDKVVLGLGDINPDEIDLWNDEDIYKNFVDNPVGRYYTGVGDFVISNAAIAVATKGAGIPFKAALKRSGLTTKSTSLAEYERDIDDHLLFEQSNGTQGRITARGAEISNLAKNTDPNYIQNVVGAMTNNEKLLPIIRETTDPAVVRDIVLADKGYLPALDRLSRNSSSKLAEIADLPGTLRAKNALDNQIYQPEGLALDRIRGAFDDLIEKNPEFKRTKEAFFDPKGNLTVFGKDAYVPIEPVFGKKLFIKATERGKQISAASTTRDFSKIGGIEERVLSSGRAGGLTARLIRFTGSYKPMGYVTFSGARPLDGLVEVDSFFDDIDIFRNGSSKIEIAPGKFQTAADYRNEFKARYMSAKNDLERKALLDELDDKLGDDITRTLGLYSEDVRNYVAQIKAQITANHNGMARKGFGIDYNGNAIMTDPLTQSQLADSHRMIPWNIIEKELVRVSKKSKTQRGAMTAEEISKSVFEIFNKYWSFDVLARPTYIIKQSWFEPLLSAGLSEGFSFLMREVPTFTKNFLLNTKNRVNQQVTRIATASEAKAVNTAVENISEQLDKAVQNLDMLLAEVDRMMDPNLTSPATRNNNLPLVKSALNKAESLVDSLELELRNAAKPYSRDVASVPTIAGLERRIKYIEKNAPTDFLARNASLIANAKAAIGKTKGEINTLMPERDALIKAYDDIAKTYDEIDNILIKELGEKKAQQAALFGKSAEYKKRYYGRESDYRMVNGQWVNIESMFSENNLGAALRSEFENGRTVAATYLSEFVTGTRLGGIVRRSPGGIVDVQSPLYFDELAWVTNRYMRNDPMIKLILEGKDEKALLQWAFSSEGKAYVSQWGDVPKGAYLDFVRNRVGFVNRYLPNAKVRSLVLQKEVTAVDLQQGLARELDKLSAIQPIDFNYDTSPQLIGKGAVEKVDEAANRAMSHVWSFLTRPENPIRWTFADKVFYDVVARKANVLARQGVEITPATLNSLRAAATREALQETEKTFYNVRRSNRALWAARTLVAFPTASVNAFYRYGRFAIKNPARIAGFLHSYQSFFQSFGIDKYGLPVEDPRDAVYIMVPGTKEAGLFNGEGVRLNARSIGFLLNYPSPSWISTVPVAWLLEKQPNSEEMFKQVLGPSYEVLFPYGPPEGVAGVAASFVPNWVRDFKAYLTGDEGRRDYLESVKSVANYYRTLDEMGLGKFPGMEKVRKDARELYRIKGQNAASVFGVPIKVDTRPTLLWEQYYDILVNKWTMQGFNSQQARTMAGDEFLATMGPNFPLDRVTYKGSTAKFFTPPTSEAFSRVMVDNPSLVEQLYKINPELVGLMTMDLDENKEDFNLSVYRILKDPKTKLPTGQLINEIALTPEQEEERRLVNRTWAKYNKLRDALDKQAIALSGGDKTKSIRNFPEMQQALSEYGNTVLRKENQRWWEDWQAGLMQDRTFQWGRGIMILTQNPVFMENYGNKSPFWQDAKRFIDSREAIAEIYKSFKAGDSRKSQLRKTYLATIDSLITTYHPKLQEIIKRYFDDDNLKKVK